jgi:hypothetical protein
MNFDFGAVLSRAGQITWKYKNLWLAGIVISLVGFLSAPINLMFNPATFADSSEVSRQLPSILLANGLVILLTILSMPLSVIGMSVPSLGTIQLEKGSDKLNFRELIKGVLPYFWRILGVFLLLGAGMVLVVMVFMGCIVLLSIFTMGIGALCAVPFVILFIPLAIFVTAIMEQSMSAILVDNMSLSNALQRGWELIRKNLGVMALMSVIIYVGSMIVSMFVSIPMMVPMFGFLFNLGSEPDLQSVQQLSRNMILWMLAFSPLYALLQGVLLTFMQSTWTLTYLRLTRGTQGQPLLQGATS